MFRLGCGRIVIVLIGIPIVCQRFLPWWGTLAVVLGEILLLVVGGPRLFAYLLKRFAISLFMTKSRVLRGAMVSVERVEPTTKPLETPELEDRSDPDDEEDEDEDVDGAPPKDLRYVLVEFRLTPKPAQSRMQFYDPSELMLVPHDLVVSVDEDDPTADARSGSVHEIQIMNDDGHVEEAYKVTGPARFRAVFACPPGLTGRVKFRYYFETFGDVMLTA